MKKSLLFLFAIAFSSLISFSQTTLIAEAPSHNGTTQQRAPNGTAAQAYMQAAALVLQSELTLIPASSTLTQFGFTLSAGTTGAAVTGNFTVYLQNTTDLAYSKGTTWSNIITGMTNVYASVMTVPLTANTTSIILTLSTPFVYNGQGLYVAYDWASTGPYATGPATYYSESLALNPGSAAGGSSSSSSAPTLSTSAFRSTFLFGLANPYSNDVRIAGIESHGRIPAVLNAPHNVRALVMNSSNTTLNNIPVSMNVAGANAFTDTQVITSLAAGASQIVTFAAYNPLQPGPQTVSVTVPSDQFNGNNLATFPQNVTCNTWGQNPASGSFTNQSVGFNQGSGLLVTTMNMPVNTAITGMRGAIAQNAPSVGNSIYGVLLNSSGNIIATTNTIVITTPMLGTFKEFYFSSPQTIAASTTYYFGFAQTANTILGYHPAGAQFSKYMPPGLYYYTGITGGALTLLTQNFGYFGLEALFQHTVTITAASQTVTCGSPATLNAISSTNYSWSTSGTTSSIVVSPTLNTTYTVSATNTLGCAASTTVDVKITPIAVSAVVSPTAICIGNSATLTANGAANFTWTAPTAVYQSAQIVESPASSITYTLKGMDANGCANTTLVPLTVNSLPILNVSTSNPSVCAGNSVMVTASGNSSTYLWSHGPATNSAALSPLTTEVFTVTGKSSTGCEQVKTVTVTVNTFTPGITSPTAICYGQEITLFTTGASTVIWSNNSTFGSISVTPAISTSYYVTGRGFNGCVGSATTTVTVNSNPTVTTAATKTVVCRSNNTTLTAVGAETYSWSSGQTTSLTVFTSTVAKLYTFTVTGYNSSGCSHSVTLNIKVDQCTGIDEIGWEKISIFPNPTAGDLYLSVPDAYKNATVMMFNTAGQQVFVKSLNTETTQIDLKELSNGVYQLNILVDDKIVKSSRIIKN